MARPARRHPPRDGAAVMIPYLTPGLWWAVNNGHSKRAWFLIRDHADGPTDSHFDARGYLIRYASFETAQKAADRLNAAEATS